MEKQGFGLDNDSSASNQKQSNSREARLSSIKRCIKYLSHACECRDVNCRLPSCWKMKRVVEHTKTCKLKSNSGCPICKPLLALCCYHAYNCLDRLCPVPYCAKVKNNLKQQQLKQRLQQAQILSRCIATLRDPRMPGAVLQTNTGNSGSSKMDSDLCDIRLGKDNHIHKTENLDSKLGGDSRAKQSNQDRKQIDQESTRLLSFRCGIKYLAHACVCEQTNCKWPGCSKMKGYIQHVKVCKLRSSGRCSTCKSVFALLIYHIKDCQLKHFCPLPFCPGIKNVLKQRLAPILRKLVVTMQHGRISSAVLQMNTGNSGSPNQPSSGSQPLPTSPPQAPQPGIGMKPSTGPPVDALQAVQQVQAASARQTDIVPHIVTSVNYDDFVVSSPELD